MRRAILALWACALLAAWVPAPAGAAFGLHDLELSFTEADGGVAAQAGSHPFAATTSLGVDTFEDQGLGLTLPSGDFRDLTATLPPGLVADRSATAQCSAADFRPPGGGDPACARTTMVGIARVELGQPGDFIDAPVYNLIPPPGVLARIGFAPIGAALVIDLGVSQAPPYRGIAKVANVLQVEPIYSSTVTLWGVPGDPAHDAQRGAALDGAQRPFLTLPRSCSGPLLSRFEAISWQGEAFAETIAGPGMGGCEKLGFAPSISAQPTSRAAQSPTGLDFGLDVDNPGLTEPKGIAGTDIKKAVVTLPEGMTVNPSQAEGLEVCSEADLARETLAAEAGEGCPDASKIGTLEVESPLLEDEILKGSLFVAEPYANLAGDSLLALYIVIKDRELGILVTQPARVDPNPRTGQLTTTTEDMPQLPFSHFRLHFREGARSPLVTPPACGSFDVEATLYPFSGAAPLTSSSSFQVISGPNNGPCPSGGLPPFKPGLIAGTLNNRAGSYSPFNLRLHRSDSEQEFTRFSIKLPPGLVGKLAGIPYCPETAIAAAKARTGPLGGHEELAAPSCPAASQIGRTLAGAGVGPALAYAPGKLYLAGPYNGSALSMVAITAGVVGPFDVGTVVVRQAFQIDRTTAEVFIDATGSDPIPHIIKGIPVHLRDIRAYADRPEFVLNPTSCERTSTASTLLGSGLDFASDHDNNPVVVSTPFQAADCAALGFKPRLAIRLIGGTKRGAFPKLRAFLQMKRGEANVSYARVTLPPSAFLEQGHIRTICTRVQYAADACPPGSIYGYAKAITPLLDTPVEGPVYLRSSEHKLPDLVAGLRNGQIEIDLIGRVDSFKGRIRTTFESTPDAPVDTFTLTMQGAAKGLIVNSANLCKAKQRAIAEFKGHNGRARKWRPVVEAKCKGKKQGRSKRAGHGGR